MIQGRFAFLRRIATALFLLFLSIFFLLAGVLLFVRVGLDADRAAQIVIHRVQAATGAVISVSSAQLSWVSVDRAEIVCKDLKFKERPDSPVILKIPVLTLEMSALPALRGVLMIERLDLAGPELYLLAGNGHKAREVPPNLNTRQFKLQPLVKQLRISEGRIFSGAPGQSGRRDAPVFSGLRITGTDLSPAGAESLQVAGTATENGSAGTFEISGRLNSTPFWDKFWSGEVTIGASGCPILPVRMLAACFDYDLPFSQGSVNAAIKVGLQNGNFSALGRMELFQAVLLPGLVFPDKVPLDTAVARFSVQRVDDTLAVDLTELVLPGVAVALEMKIGNVFSSAPSIDLNVKRADLDLKQFFPLLPTKLLKKEDRERLESAGLKGHVLLTGGSWSGKISELATDWTGRGSLFVDAYVDRVSGFIPGFGLPIGDATGRLRLTADEVICKGISFTLGNSPIVLNGWISDLKHSPKSDLFLSMTAQAQDFLPILDNKAVSSRIERWLGWISEPQGGVSVTLDIKGDLSNPAMKGRIGLEDFQCNASGLPLPLKKINGSLRFRGSTVSFSELKGTAGDSPFEITGEIGPNDTHVSSEVKLFAADAKKLNALPAQLITSGAIPVSITYKGKLPDGTFSGRADLKGNALEWGKWVKKLPGTPLSLEFSGGRSGGVTTIEEAYLVLADARISGKIAIADEGKITASINLPPKGIPTSVLIPYTDSSLELQPGGRIEGDALIRTTGDRPRELNVESNVILNHISLHLPGFYKRTEGFTGTIRRRGKSFVLSLERAKIGSSLLSGSLSITNGEVPRLEIAVDFSFLDTSDFTAPPGYVSPMTWGEWIRANPVIRFLARSRGSCIMKVAKGKTTYRTFSDFRAAFEGSGGTIRVPNWQTNFAEGILRGTALFDIREMTSKPFVLNFQADHLQMERVILSEPDRVKIEGSIVAEGQLDWKLGPKRDNNGIFKSGTMEVRVQDGTIHRFEVLSKISSLINLGSIVRGRLPDIIGQGLPFQRLTWNMEVFNNKWKIKDLKLTSDAARIDSSGMYFSGQDRVDFRVDVSPLVGLDTIVSGLFGNLITKDGKTLTWTLRVRGQVDSPDVRLEPFEPVKSDEQSKQPR